MLIKNIKSIWILVVIFIQKLIDNIYRFIYGIPMLKRSQITASLFLGGQYNLQGLHRLKAIGITAIINMRTHSVYTAAQYHGMKYLHLPTVDNKPPTLDNLIKGASFAEEVITKGGKVYIHCRQGLGRGPSMCIAYLLKIGTTFDDAFTLVKNVRTFIRPTQQQIARLKELEKYFKEHNMQNTGISPLINK